MGNQPELDAEFREVLQSNNTYFQPPASVRMKYPAIRYHKNPGAYRVNAGDKLYRKVDQFEGVIIDPDPDSKIPDKLLERFPMCSFSPSYCADNLNHFPFTIYY